MSIWSGSLSQSLRGRVMTRILLFFLDWSQLTASGGREKPDQKHVVFAAAKREAAWRDAAWRGQRPLPLKPVCPVRPQK